MKLVDLVHLELEGSKLTFDQLQFAYQRNSSTTTCSWMVSSVIEHFNKKGTTVYAASMDMSKAFDMVNWRILFSNLLERNINPLFLRVITFTYKNQRCQVRWGNAVSNQFSVSNGVRQGGVSSAILFAIYIDGLIKLLRESGFGCSIYGEYCGVFIFADDVILLSATRNGLQTMVDLSQRFVRKRNLKFGTDTNPRKSKTKCIIFSPRKVLSNPKNIILQGNMLPWVDEVLHLGITLQCDNSMKRDINKKRCIFNNKLNSLLQEFHSASPTILLKCANTYALSFPGSQIWDLFNEECEKLYRSWNVMIRKIYNLNRCTHRYLIEPLSDTYHLKTALCSRFVKFSKTLTGSNKFSV